MRSRRENVGGNSNLPYANSSQGATSQQIAPATIFHSEVADLQKLLPIIYILSRCYFKHLHRADVTGSVFYFVCSTDTYTRIVITVLCPTMP